MKLEGVSRLKRIVSRLGSVVRIWVAISWLTGVLLAPGCDSMSFVPPPRPELANPAQTSAGAVSTAPVVSHAGSTKAPVFSSAGHIDGVGRLTGGGKFVELILVKTPTPERVYLAQALRRDLGNAKMLLRYTKPEAVQKLSPEQLAAAIRTAIGRGSAALLVEPIDDPTVLDRLYEAQSRGMKVLLLDQPIPPRSGKSIPVFCYQSFSKPGRQIVEAVLEAAKLTHRLNGGRIVVFRNRSTDAYSADRLASLTEPLKAAGLKYEILDFDGDANAAKEVLTSALAVPPRISIVLAQDDEGFAASHLILSRLIKQGEPDFLLGGYNAYDMGGITDTVNKATAFCDRSVEAYASKAFQTVRNLIEGKAVADRTEVPVVFHHAKVIYVPTTPER